MIGDDIHGQMPELSKDPFWGQSNPLIPHTVASLKRRDIVFEGHLASFKLKQDEMSLVEPEEEDQVLEELQREAGTLNFQNLIRTITRWRRQRDLEGGEQDVQADN